MIDAASVPATLPELLGLVEQSADFVSYYLTTGPRTSLMPQLAVLCRGVAGERDGIRVFALAVPFNTDAQKRATMRRIGRSLYAEKAVPAGAALMTEAWTSPDPGPGKRPEDHPDRKEVVVITASSIRGTPAVLQQMVVGRDLARNILPGPLQAPLIDGVRAVLLQYLWAGFFEATAARYGLPDLCDGDAR